MSLSTWLSSLKQVQLSRVAFLTGAPTSGTKPALIRHIWDAIENGPTKILDPAEQPSSKSSLDEASIVSIDLGLRNLAYAHLTTRRASNKGKDDEVSTGSPTPTLKAWQRIDASSVKVEEKVEDSETSLPEVKEVLDSATLAAYAYHVGRKILYSYQPTHILLERQRFRSGGGAAVQEWSLRVGVFEGMLHGVLKTLITERNLNIEVHSIDPGRVTRYWLQGRHQGINNRKVPPVASKIAKIDIVGKLLVENGGGLFETLTEKGEFRVNKTAETFLASWKRRRKVLEVESVTKKSVKGTAKLDDLSDCLLQGIAWMEWQNKREDVRLRGADAFADDPVIFPAMTEAVRETQGTARTTEASLRSKKRNVKKAKTA